PPTPLSTPPCVGPSHSTTFPTTRATRRILRRLHTRTILRLLRQQDSAFLDTAIQDAENERTQLAKADMANPKRLAIDRAHSLLPTQPNITQRSRNIAYNIHSGAKRAHQRLTMHTKHVQFANTHTVRLFPPTSPPTVFATLDSGADGHYLSERDRALAQLPILRPSSKRVGVANGGSSQGRHVTKLPFTNLSANATQADTFDDFPNSLISVGRLADDNTVSIFTRDGVTVHKEHDVLITCRGNPVLIGVRDEHGRYRVPLIQTKGQWQPRLPKKRVTAKLREANSVYDLPSIEQAIRWMHAVCGYPVKSTWLKAVKAGNFIGWPLLTEKNITKYFPDTPEVQQGHMAQTRKHVRSTKRSSKAFASPNVAPLQGKKERDLYTTVYDVRETTFSDQTGRFPTQSQRGNKYVMVMVEIDSNAILLEPMKSRQDREMIRAYDALTHRLLRAGIQPKKHVLDNEISSNMKEHIRTKYNFMVELVPPGCHRRNAAEVAIRNFKSHFLSILAGTADSFPLSLWDRLLPQTEITLNLLRQSNATPTVSAYAHLCGPFDYNKMPLAPMGCEVQVHEKTDQRGTWAYHCVDGWYLFTSPEHYRVHNCHIKSTKAERLSDTIHFRHKNITNPSITPQDKLMQALANCKAALSGTRGSPATPQIQELQRLVNLTHTTLEHRNTPVSAPAPCPSPPTTTPPNHTVPRVPPALPTTPHHRTPTTAPPPDHLAVAKRIKARQQRIRAASPQIFLPSQPPALSTRSRVHSRIATPPPTHLPSTKRRTRARLTHQANAVEDFKTGRFLSAFRKLETQVERALAVLDKDSGKQLNYRQLLRHPKYK
ncbi:hypothetical protein ACHAW6_005919, partial [Cyclotella cf. meneghiniana]